MIIITSFRSATQNLSCTAFSNFWSLANVRLYSQSIWRYKYKDIRITDQNIIEHSIYFLLNDHKFLTYCNTTKSLSISSFHPTNYKQNLWNAPCYWTVVEMKQLLLQIMFKTTSIFYYWSLWNHANIFSKKFKQYLVS